MDRDKAGCIGYIIGGIILFSCQFIGACVSTKSTYQAASDLGFSNVHIIEHDYMFLSFRGCGAGDAAKFTFTALNQKEKPVTMYTCVGIFKGATIRSE